MVQSRSLKKITFEQSSFCLRSVWLPLPDALASMAATISSQPGREFRINKDRPIMRPTGMKSLATIGGIENKISPRRHKGRLKLRSLCFFVVK
jgi:hypothetical protein